LSQLNPDFSPTLLPELYSAMAVRAGRLHANKGYWRDGLYPFPRSNTAILFSSLASGSMASPSLLYRPFLLAASATTACAIYAASTRTNAPRTPKTVQASLAAFRSSCGASVEMSSSSNSNESAREVVSMAQVPECPRPRRPVRQTCAPKPAPPFERANRFVVGLDRSVRPVPTDVICPARSRRGGSCNSLPSALICCALRASFS